MRHTATLWMLAMTAAGCATSASWTRESTAPRSAGAVRAERETARLETERAALRRSEAERALAELPRTADATERRRIIVRVLALDPSAVTDLAPAQIAALAPDVLRVYDLGAVLDDGLDDPADIAPADVHERDLGGAELLLRRIAARLGAADVRVAGDCLVLLDAPDSFAGTERTLDRVATVGGRALRVSATATNGAETSSVTFDVPLNRRRGAIDGSQISYVKDFDVDAASAFADPVVATIDDGFGVTAEYDGDRVAFDVVVSRVTTPIPEFTTMLIDGQRPVRLQVPTVEASRRHAELRVGDAAAAADIDVGAWSVRLSVEPSPATSTPARSGSRRVAAGSGWAPAEVEPLVENAVRIASAQVASDDCDAAVEALKTATFGARGRSWTRRLRIGSRPAPVALVRRESDRPRDEVRAAIDDAGARAAGGFGFIEVRDGVVAACVDPDSVSAVDRALGALARAPRQRADLSVTTPLPVATLAAGCDSGSPPGLTCTSAAQVSFIQDFDLSYTDDAVVADPVVGVLQSGACVHARPVASSPGTYDVTTAHAVLEKPIATFETPLGAGPPVTLQLPRMRVRRSTTRVTVERGAPLTIATSLGSDERSFVLTRE